MPGGAIPGAGRKPKILNAATVERLARIGATNEEIGVVCDCSRDTVQERIKDTPEIAAAIARGRADLKVSLRRMQVKLARTGNATMLIWLGKQLLDQHDKTEVTGDGGGPLQVQMIRRVVVDPKDGTADRDTQGVSAAAEPGAV